MRKEFFILLVSLHLFSETLAQPALAEKKSTTVKEIVKESQYSSQGNDQEFGDSGFDDRRLDDPDFGSNELDSSEFSNSGGDQFNDGLDGSDNFSGSEEFANDDEALLDGASSPSNRQSRPRQQEFTEPSLEDDNFDDGLDGSGGAQLDDPALDQGVGGEFDDELGGAVQSNQSEFDDFSREKPRPSRRSLRRSIRPSGSARQALQLLKAGDAEQASALLYEIGRKQSGEEKMKTRYLLGLALMRMKLYQAAAFQFIQIVRNGRGQIVSQSLEKISIVAGLLRDNSLVDYAISRMKNASYSRKQRDLLYYRKGEYLLRNKNFIEAAKSFSRVRGFSRYYFQAKYKEGLAWASAKQENRALRAFRTIVRNASTKNRTDKTRVSAQLAIARVLYQKKNWESSIDAYRQIPRDSVYWHDALFEQSWAYLMSSKFRSALSTFHSTHSPYYEKFFVPESLVLRAIVYLYICNYSEMEKVVQLFEKIYTPLNKDLKRYLEEPKKSLDFYDDFNHYLKFWRHQKKSEESSKAKYRGEIPAKVAQHLLKDGVLRQLYSYLYNLYREKRMIGSRSVRWRSSGIGEYAQRAVQKRIQKVSGKIGEKVKNLLKKTNADLQAFVEQNSFLRFEMLSEQKKRLKQNKAPLTQAKKRIGEGEERDFFIQNGYEYWPFDGEYWLDELGNYHYLGLKSCANR